MRELMVRAIYCEMLGYDASFSYIHAIKLAQQGSALEKRVGRSFKNLFIMLLVLGGSLQMLNYYWEKMNNSSLNFVFQYLKNNIIHLWYISTFGPKVIFLCVCRLSGCVFVSEWKSWIVASPCEYCIKGGCQYVSIICRIEKKIYW